LEEINSNHNLSSPMEITSHINNKDTANNNSSSNNNNNNNNIILSPHNSNQFLLSKDPISSKSRYHNNNHINNNNNNNNSNRSRLNKWDLIHHLKATMATTITSAFEVVEHQYNSSNKLFSKSDQIKRPLMICFET